MKSFDTASDLQWHEKDQVWLDDTDTIQMLDRHKQRNECLYGTDDYVLLMMEIPMVVNLRFKEYPSISKYIIKL